MMKLTKIGLLVLGVGVLVVAFVALYLAYSQYVSRRDTLVQTIEVAQTKLAQINTDRRTTEPQLAQLQQKISELTASYNRAVGDFPTLPAQSIEYDNELSDLAEQCSVTLSSLTATNSTSLKEGNFTYVVTDFTVQVTGDRTSLLDYIHRVSLSSYFATASVTSVTLAGGKATPTPTPTATGIATPTPTAPPALTYYTVDMAISVYRYGGS